MPGMAQSPQPQMDSMAWWLSPFANYWKRTQALAQGSLEQANQGAQQVQQGDLPAGMANMLLGPLGYVSSPINALLPSTDEVYQASRNSNLSPETASLLAGGVGAMAMGLPGPKVKGLGKGMGSLMQDVSPTETAALANRLAAEARQSGGQASNVSRDQALANLTQAPQGITAYHGSPHTFDKFDMSKIGTGEGAQAYGHGLYFAENENIARDYKTKLSAAPTVDVGGQRVTPAKLAFDNTTPDQIVAARISARRKAYDQLGHGDESVPQVMSEVRNDLQSGIAGAEARGDTKILSSLRAQLAYLDEAERAGMAVKPQGSMYQVRLNVKPDELLDWDKPLSEQPKNIQQIATEQGWTTPPKGFQGQGEPLGQNIHAWATDRTGSGWDTPGTATKLKAAGIKGIRYKDAGSRSGEGGTYNYVIFDDKLIDILKRYGIPIALGAGGAAVVAGQNLPPDVRDQLQGS